MLRTFLTLALDAEKEIRTNAPGFKYVHVKKSDYSTQKDSAPEDKRQKTEKKKKRGERTKEGKAIKENIKKT